MSETAFESITMNKHLTLPEIRKMASERARKADGPYWAFIWTDAKGGIRNINFRMPSNRCISIFENTHPCLNDYNMIGKNT